jgi:ribosomal protein L32
MNVADAGAEFRLNRLLQKKRLEEMELVVCHHCGEEQPRGSRVCSSCGKRLVIGR